MGFLRQGRPERPQEPDPTHQQTKREPIFRAKPRAKHPRLTREISGRMTKNQHSLAPRYARQYVRFVFEQTAKDGLTVAKREKVSA
jgi:hypothetical protein